MSQQSGGYGQNDSYGSNQQNSGYGQNNGGNMGGNNGYGSNQQSSGYGQNNGGNNGGNMNNANANQGGEDYLDKAFDKFEQLAGKKVRSITANIAFDAKSLLICRYCD
jgi:hypothetical protein